jgi:hypothetical protein
MYIFKDINKKYPHHILSHSLLSSGMLLAIGIAGIVLAYEPTVVFLALLCTLVGGLVARVFLVHLDYTGGIRWKHLLTTVASIAVSAILLAWTYKSVGQMVEPQFRRLVLPFLLTNLLLMHLPFLIVHGVKCIKQQPLS